MRRLTEIFTSNDQENPEWKELKDGDSVVLDSTGSLYTVKVKGEFVHLLDCGGEVQGTTFVIRFYRKNDHWRLKYGEFEEFWEISKKFFDEDGNLK